MNFLLTLRIAFRALAKNKLRAALTVLGVVIGIAAVTTMISIGQSANALVQNELNSFGTNFLVVIPNHQRRGPVRSEKVVTLTRRDIVAIKDECDSVAHVSPNVVAGGQVIYGNQNTKPNQMWGVGEEYLKVKDWPILAGSFFSDRDVSSGAKVCVLGITVVRDLFQTENPLNATIRINNIPFRVIGVLEEKGANMVGEDQDNVLLMPFTTARMRLRGSMFDNIDFAMISAKARELVPQAQTEIIALLSERHRLDPRDEKDFRVETSAEASQFLGVLTGTMTLLLSSIAGISLLVGGVGIMNIMLVSVTERTREIGIRMAVGARPQDILRQFLVESILLSSLGGVAGVILGVLASVGVTQLINTFTPTEWPLAISMPAAIVAMIFAAVVGVFFGYYPARRASQLDPIDALRYE